MFRQYVEEDFKVGDEKDTTSETSHTLNLSNEATSYRNF